MADPAAIQAWLDKNKDKAGTDEYVTMTEALNNPQPAVAGAAPVRSSGALGGAVEGLKNFVGWPKPLTPGSEIPTVEERLKFDRGNESPYSFSNRADRIGTSIISALPDTAAALANAGTRAAGYGDRVPYLAPYLRAQTGAKELPADAPWQDRWGEGLATAALSGGRSASTIPRSLAINTVAGAGALGGSELANAAGGGETAQLLASLVGGMAAPQLTRNAARYAAGSSYAGHGRPEGLPGMNEPGAAAIDAATRQVGSAPGMRPGTSYIEPTPAMIGDRSVQDLISKLGTKPGSGPRVTAADNQVRTGIEGLVSDIARMQGGGDASSPAVIGGNAIRMAQPAMEALQTQSDAAAQSLRGPMGRMELPVGSIQRAGERLLPDLAGPGQDAVNARLGATGPGLGRITSYPHVPGRPTVPASQLFDYRTNLGKSFDQGSTPAVKELYGPTTRVLRTGAQQVGIPPAQFDAANAVTQLFENQHRPALEAVTGRDAPAAHQYLLEGGEKVPARLTDFRDAMATANPAGGAAQAQSLFGSHLNNILAETLRNRGGYAPGPVNFADRIQHADPQSIRELAGSLPSAQQLEDAAIASRALHRPTQQGGAGKMVQGVAENTADAAVSGGLGYKAAKALRLPDWAATAIAGALSYAGPRYLNNARLDVANSPSARAAMTGQPIPYRLTPNISDVRSAIAATQGSTSYPQQER